MGYSWIWPLMGALAAILALYLSQPARPRIAIGTAVLIAISAIVQARDSYLVEKRAQQVEWRIADRLARSTRGFLSLLAAVAIRGSDGFVPDSDEKFFSRRMSEVLCRETDVRSIRPEFQGGMLEEVAVGAHYFHDELRSVLDSHSSEMSPALLNAVTQMDAARIFPTLEATPKLAQFDKDHNVSRPPLLCWGLEPLMEDSLTALGGLVRVIREEERRFNLNYPEDWLLYPPHYLQKYLGVSRFGPEQLERFGAEHPDSPGPATFGVGNPSKSPQLDKRSAPWRQR